MEQNILPNTADKREYWIDCVKIFAAFLVILTHLFSFGGIIEIIDNASLKGFLLNILRSVSLCSVNLFGFCTGYLCVGKKTKYSKLLQFWIQIVFLSVSVLVINSLITRSISEAKPYLISSFLPLTYNNYWFFSVYIALSLFSDFYNKLIDNMSKKEFMLLISLSFVLFVLLFSISARDSLYVFGGYSLLWLTVCYFFGAYIKKYSVSQKVKMSTIVILGILMLLAYPVFCFVYQIHPFTIFGGDTKTFIYKYNSVNVFIASLMIFLAFSRIKVKNSVMKKILVEFSSASLAVYIIHMTSVFKNKFIVQKFSWIVALSPAKSVLAVLLVTLVIFIALSVFSIFQIKFFKLIKINKLCDNIELFVRKKISKIYGREKLDRRQVTDKSSQRTDNT